MSTFTTNTSHVSGYTSWLRWFRSPVRKDFPQEEVQIDTDDLSEHMLRDLGFLDGRSPRGDHSEMDYLKNL